MLPAELPSVLPYELPAKLTYGTVVWFGLCVPLMHAMPWMLAGLASSVAATGCLVVAIWCPEVLPAELPTRLPARLTPWFVA